MALRYLAPNIMFSREKTNRAVIRSSMIHKVQPSPKAATPSIRSFIQNKMVFEDMGIICYKDEKGELVCEGYDEGPRYSRQELEEEEKHEKKRQVVVPCFRQSSKTQPVEDAYLCQAFHKMAWI